MQFTMGLLITCLDPDSDDMAAVIGHERIPIPDAALTRSSVLRTVAGDVQAGEHVPIPADATAFQQWLKTVNAVNEVQCQALLTSLRILAVAQIVQVSPSLPSKYGQRLRGPRNVTSDVAHTALPSRISDAKTSISLLL